MKYRINIAVGICTLNSDVRIICIYVFLMLQVLISDIATYNCYLLMLQLLFINVTTDRPKKNSDRTSGLPYFMLCL